MKKIIGSFLALLILASFSVHANASEQDDLFIQVDLNGDPGECSIMKSKPDGTISEFVSNSQILSTTGLTSADCDDTGLAVGLNGRVFFSEDDSDNILVANPNGTVSTFVTDTVVNMLLPTSVDWDNGMAINPVTGTLVAADENNEAIIEFPTNVPTPILNPALINILAVEADFLALVTTVDLEGGIAIDFEGNIYITNDDSGNDVDNVIFKLTSAGDLSILCTQAQFTAVAGIGPEVDFDMGMAIDGNLFVADDGDCECVIEIDPVTCDPQILITEAQIIALTGGTEADLEGGVCIDTNMNLFIGDDGDDVPNIIKVPILNPNLASIFVSQAEIDNLYATISPLNPRLEGSCGVKQADTPTIPTLSEWGLIAMAAILGIVGFIVARRRMVKA